MKADLQAYIVAHHEAETIEQMGVACGVTPSRIGQLCRDLGLRAVRGASQRIKVIRAAEGEKTVADLAAELNCTPKYVLSLCKRHHLPYASGDPSDEPILEVNRAHYRCWSSKRRARELNREIQSIMAQGFSRMKAFAILEELADFLSNIPTSQGSGEAIVRPRAIYSNRTTDQLIDLYLGS